MNLGALTVVVLTRDEERNVSAALDSLPRGFAVLVVDAESSDRTAQIARERGAVVIVRRWTDFVEARRFALDQVRTPWAFMLDADERLDPRLRESLLRADPESDGYDAYRVRRATRFCGATIDAFGWADERLVRIFRVDRARIEPRPAAGGTAALHERWMIDGRVGELDGVLVHDSYPDRATYRRKFARYTSLEAEGLASTPLQLLRAAAIAPLRLLWLLVARGGLRAGWRGIYLALWSALYPVAVHLKARR